MSTAEDMTRGPGASDAELSALCSGCSMCCDGALFHWTAVDQETHEVLLRHQLPVVQHEGRAALLLPCTARDEAGLCRIYDDRPLSCATYRCNVLRDLEEGVLGPEQAHAKIERAKAQIRALYLRLGGERVGLRAIKQLVADKQGSATWRRDNGELLVDLVAFVRLLEVDFGTEPLRSD